MIKLKGEMQLPVAPLGLTLTIVNVNGLARRALLRTSCLGVGLTNILRRKFRRVTSVKYKVTSVNLTSQSSSVVAVHFAIANFRAFLATRCTCILIIFICLQPIKTRAELDSGLVDGLLSLKQIFYEYHPLILS